MPPREDNIRYMIEEINSLGRNLTKWEESFMEDITDQWQAKQWLSERQEEILTRIYEERVR